MKKPTLAELQAWFAAAPRNFGWEMIFAYDRHTLNEVLLREYIERFGEARYLPLISTSLDSGRSSMHLSRIHLRSPRLSFEHADLESGEVRLVMDFIGGLIITTETISGVSEVSAIREIIPANGPRLAFAVPLINLSASIGDDRLIRLDLSRGDEYVVNFSLDTLTEEDLGRRFSLAFAEMGPDIRSFGMGKVDEALTHPRKLLMRIMAAPDAMDGEPDRYGDGALIMFLRFDGEHDGTLPDKQSDFLYPIPAPSLFVPFSTTMIMGGPYAAGALSPAVGYDTWPLVDTDLMFGDTLDFHAYGLGFNGEHLIAALYGCAAPKAKTFALSPHLPYMFDGGHMIFSTQPAVSDVKWSVHPTAEGDSHIGKISTSGLYSGPPSPMPYASQLVMIKAEGVLDGQRGSALTLVTILRDTLQVSPRFAICAHGSTIQLGAETPGQHEEPTWSLRDPGNGGELSRSSGPICFYKARKADHSDPPILDTIDVYNPTSMDTMPIHVLVTNQGVPVPLFISEDSRPETNQVQLRVVFDGREMDLGDIPLGYTVVEHGYTRGSIDARGVYSAPADATGVVVLMLDIEDPFLWLCGFLALPLPLWAHADALSRSNESLRTHARATLAKSPDVRGTP